jgi:hypothetical protein
MQTRSRSAKPGVFHLISRNGDQPDAGFSFKAPNVPAGEPMAEIVWSDGK